jgi:hypothetical protein
MHRAIVGIGLLLVLVIGMPTLALAYQDSVSGSQPGAEPTEQFTAQPDTTYTVANTGEYLVHNDSVTVSYNGTTYQGNGDDYRWTPGDATLYVTSDSDIPSGVEANLTYQYYEPSQEQRYLAQLSSTTTQTGEFWGIVAGAGILLAFVVVLVRLGGA